MKQPGYRVAPRSYEVQCNAQTYRRNRKDLRPRPEQLLPTPTEVISFVPTSDLKSSETPSSDSSDGSPEKNGTPFKYLLMDLSSRHQNASSRTVIFKVFISLRRGKCCNVNVGL